MITKMRKYVQGLLWPAGRRSTEARERSERPAFEPMEPRLLLSAWTYTSSDDFDAGATLNLNHDSPADQLQINAIAEPFPYVNVACTGRGTLVRIHSETGAIVGEYAAAPDGMDKSPARTAVDLLGNVWVANIAEDTGGMGSVTRIALVIGGTRGDKNGDGSFTPDDNGEYLQGPFDYNTAIDRDGDGLIRTSSGLGNVLAWTNAGGADTLGGVSTAEDEAIINYTRTTAKEVGTLAIDANNDLWVGGTVDKIHEKISGVTGEPIPGSQINPIAGGYGGLLDANGVLWSITQPGSTNILRYDTNTPTPQVINLGTGNQCHGVGIDTDGYLFVSNPSGNNLLKIRPTDGAVVRTFDTGATGPPQGVAVRPADNSFWVANWGLGRVYGRTSEGVLVATPAVGLNPIGVSVDAAGKVWAISSASDTASRINRAAPGAPDLVVNLGAGAASEGLGDMTGVVAMSATSRQGSWTVVEDGGEAGTAWGSITWNEEEEGSVPESIIVQARAAETHAGLAGEPFVDVTSGEALSLTGQFIEVQATLKAAADGTSPVLSDLTIETAEDEPPVANANGPYTVAEGSTVTLDGSGSTDPNQPPPPLTYEWDLDGDGQFGEIGAGAERGDEVGINPIYSAAGLDGPDSKTVALKVTNDAGLSDTGTATVEITNAAPSIAADNAEVTVDESQTAANTGTVSDPGADTVALSASIGTVVDNGNGTWSWSFDTTDGPGETQVVTITASDGDDVSAVQFNLVVSNVAPTAVDDDYATDPADMFDLLNVLPGDGVLANDSDPAGASDPLVVTSTGSLATSLGATVVMNADGGFSYDATTSGALLGLADGETAADTFSYTISDGDGGTAGATVTVTVTGTGERSVHVIESPCGDGTNALVVRGSSLNDIINVMIGPQEDYFRVTIITSSIIWELGVFRFRGAADAVSKVIVYGLAGNDSIKIHSDLEVMGWMFGGTGDDWLRGGAGNDMLVGGDGDDMVVGRAGRDLLIGGEGADRIVGNAGEDILVAGTTVYDEDLVALCGIMAEWTSANDFETRVAHITGPDGGLNGPYFLNADPDNGPVTVFYDDARDRLTGGGGADWFLANLNGDGVLDKVTDLRVGDVFSELDLEWIDSDPPEGP